MQTWAQVFTRTQGGCVIRRCLNKNPIEKLTSGCEWHHALEVRAEDFGDFENVSELSLAVRRRKVTFASSPWPCGGYHTCWGVDRWKSQNRKIVPLSPYVEKPLNSKVIKSFVPELRSCKCFSCFGIPMLYVCMSWTFYVHFTYLYHGYVTVWVWKSWNCDIQWLGIVTFNEMVI